jgi:hypothetical protein
LATKELAVAPWQHNVSHFLFAREFLTKNNMTVIPQPSYLSLFPQLKINWKAAILTQLRWSTQHCRRCWTPSQNTNSRKHFKKWQKYWEWCIRAEGDYYESDGSQ